MANTYLRYWAPPGNDVYGIFFNGNEVWNGVTWEAFNSANWASYAVSGATDTSGYLRTVEVPSGIAKGQYTGNLHDLIGAQPVISDSLLGGVTFDWNGSRIIGLNDVEGGGGTVPTFPNIRVAPRFVRNVSRRADGTGQTTEPFRVYTGEEPYIGIDMRRLYGEQFVVNAEAPTVQDAGGSLAFDPTDMGGVQTMAVYKITGTPAVLSTERAEALVTMENGDKILVVFDVSTMDETQQ